jgi:uncharacterized membrane protein YgdD (TMEM256/DUF423 family)
MRTSQSYCAATTLAEAEPWGLQLTVKVPSSNLNMRTVVTAAGLMSAAVALGAFGAHALALSLEASGHQATWDTAVLYHAIHGLAVFGIGIWQGIDPRAAASRAIRTAAALLVAGIVAFSGSLYLLSLGGPKWLGPVTPLGGACFLGGWIALAIGSWRMVPVEP